MREFIERMVRCGIPEKTAQCIYMDFVLQHKWKALMAYIITEERRHGVEGI